MQVRAGPDFLQQFIARDVQDVEFTVDAYPDAPFRGTVRQVRRAPITVQNVVTYNVVVRVDNRDLLLKPGMTANVTIQVRKFEDALKIPNAALRREAGAVGCHGFIGGLFGEFLFDLIATLDLLL